MRCNEASAVLTNNLRCLVHPHLAPRIENTPFEHVEIITSSSGLPTLRLLNRSLSSTSDPLNEAQVWVEQQQLQHTDKIVVLGFGAGYHVEELRRHFAGPIFVFEPSLELLRAAFTTRPLDLKEVTVVESLTSLRDQLGASMIRGETLNVLSWPPTRRLFPELEEGIRQAVSQAVTLAVVTTNTMESRARPWAMNFLENMVNSVGRVSAWELRKVFENRPVIFVAAGPSLNKNVHLLRQVQDRAIIFAVNTSIGALERAGVRANFVGALELLDIRSQFTSLEINRATPRVLDVNANPLLFSEAPGPVFPFIDRLAFFSDLAQKVGIGEGFPAGGSVANAIFSIAFHLGAQTMILVGQDLAYCGDQVYAAGTVFENMRAQINGQRATFDGLEAKMQIAASNPQADTTLKSMDVEKVTAWGGQGVVYTNTAFNYFRFIFESWATALNSKLNLINATEGGARIKGFTEMPLQAALASLPQATIPALPESPTITAEAVRLALDTEQQIGFQVIRQADELSRNPTEAGYATLSDTIHQSGLLLAYTWPTFYHAMHEEKFDHQTLGRRLVKDCDDMIVNISHALRKIS